jgi:hypothetical protein
MEKFIDLDMNLTSLSVNGCFYNIENRAGRGRRSGKSYWAYVYGFENREFTVSEIARHLLSGKAIIAVALKNEYRDEAEFHSGQLMAVDFGIGVSIKDLLKNDFIRNYAFLIYETDEEGRYGIGYRVLFRLDRPTTNAEQYRRWLQGLMAQFSLSIKGDRWDKATRLLYGHETETYWCHLENTLPVALLQELVNQETDEKQEATGIDITSAFYATVLGGSKLKHIFLLETNTDVDLEDGSNVFVQIMRG